MDRKVKRKRLLYGWLRGRDWCLSRLPPDVPVPHQVFASLREAQEAAANSHYQIIWCGAAAAERERLINRR